MQITIQETKDGKHKTISDSGDYDYSLHCHTSNRSVKLCVTGGITHCPLCGGKLGEWKRTERIRVGE